MFEAPDIEGPCLRDLVTSRERRIVKRLARICEVAITVMMREVAGKSKSEDNISVCLNDTKYLVLFESATHESHIQRHEFPQNKTVKLMT